MINASNMTLERALALGAMDAGVGLATSYPGSPASGTMEALIAEDNVRQIQVEWSVSERVALETAIGASIGGQRTLICAKSVGVNVMVDPLMCLNLTPLHAGMVLLIGDDPGGYGSQNEQDTRLLAPMLEMPMLEPAGPQEAYGLMRSAFDWSEAHEIPFILRVTRSAVRFEGLVTRTMEDQRRQAKGYSGDDGQFVPIPSDVVQRHRALHARLQGVAKWAETAPGNQISGAGDHGVVAVGSAWRKLRDVIGDEPPSAFRVLKLATLFPLPEGLLEEWGQNCREVLVLEEQEPYVEEHISALYHRAGMQTRVLGRLSGHLHGREGELFRWQIQEALARFEPGFRPIDSYPPEREGEEIPHKQDHCAGSGYDAIIQSLDFAAGETGTRLLLVADPGCMVAMAERLVAKYAIGSAVAVAEGLSRTKPPGHPVALIGDSAFFHSGIPALCSAARAGGDVLVVVLDNGGTRSTGGQPSPAVPRNARGERVRALSISELASACGLDHVQVVDAKEDAQELIRAFQSALSVRGPALVQVML